MDRGGVKLNSGEIYSYHRMNKAEKDAIATVNRMAIDRGREFTEKEKKKALRGPDMFHCNRNKCTMKRLSCISRQKKSRLPIWKIQTSGGLVIEQCKDCHQGKSIKRHWGGQNG